MIKRLGLASILYAGLVLFFTWPGIRDIQHTLLGKGNAFQFVWGVWWFGETIRHHLSSVWDCPVMIYPFGANLIQHDYPLWQNSIAWIAQKGGLTLVGAYNACILLGFWLNACCAFLLADTVTEDFIPAFAAGIVFAFAPFFYLAGTSQLSYTHAYSLPLTALCLYKSWGKHPLLWSLGAGCSLVLAALCSSYYAVYAATCVAVFMFYHRWKINLSISRRPHEYSGLVASLIGLGSIALVSAILLAIFIARTGGGTYIVAGRPVGLTGTANPLIVWWVSWGLAFLLRFKMGLGLVRKDGWNWTNTTKQLVCIILPLIALTPLIIRTLHLVAAGDFGAQEIGWKSGPSGAYPFAAFIPNIYHSLWGALRYASPSMQSLMTETMVGSLGWTTIAVVLATRAWKSLSWWTFGFLFFLAMSFGPFMKIFPKLDWGPVMPFWFFRYIPVAGGARMPMRWIVPALVMWSVLVAGGLHQLTSHRLRWMCLLGILIESIALPLPTSSTEIPAAYTLVAHDPAPGAILELPFCVDDARKAYGGHQGGEGYPDVKLYYQTVHHRPIVGGSIGRLPERVFEQYRKEPVLQQLVSWENGTSSPETMNTDLFKKWAGNWKISWVILDKERSSKELTEKTSALLGTPVFADSDYIVWKTGGIQ